MKCYSNERKIRFVLAKIHGIAINDNLFWLAYLFKKNWILVPSNIKYLIGNENIIDAKSKDIDNKILLGNSVQCLRYHFCLAKIL